MNMSISTSEIKKKMNKLSIQLIVSTRNQVGVPAKRLQITLSLFSSMPILKEYLTVVINFLVTNRLIITCLKKL